MAALHNVAQFITEIFFSFCIFFILLRILLQLSRASVNNPICQLTARITNPLVLPLRQILPNTRLFDLASLLILLILEIIKFSAAAMLQGFYFSFFLLIVMSVSDIILQTINILFYAIIIRIVLSWINSVSSLYLAEIVYIMTEPLLGRIRKIIHPISGFDLSPIIAFLLLKVLSIVVLSYLPG